MKNENTEQKFNQLLSSLGKKEYPLKKWMEEDETETFDRIVGNRKREKTIRRWIAAAACLVFIIGFAGIAKFSHWNERQDQLPQPAVAKIELPPQPVESKQVENLEKVEEARVSQTVRRQRKTRKSAVKSVRREILPPEPEPSKEQTDAAEENKFHEIGTRRPRIDDSFSSVARQMSDIRQRGELLSKEIAMFINDK